MFISSREFYPPLYGEVQITGKREPIVRRDNRWYELAFLHNMMYRIQSRNLYHGECRRSAVIFKPSIVLAFHSKPTRPRLSSLFLFLFFFFLVPLTLSGFVSSHVCVRQLDKVESGVCFRYHQVSARFVLEGHSIKLAEGGLGGAALLRP